MEKTLKNAIILPVLNPDIKFTNFVNELIANDFKDIIVINDGSAEDYDEIFLAAAQNKQVTLLKHEVNKGKGAALKTAFSYLFENRKDIDYAVTCDGDGQHTVNSIKNCIVSYKLKPGSVIIGGRDFNSPNVPTKNKIGNKISSKVFKFACGIELKDTQTGLRIIPSEWFENFSKIKGDRYEYETNMLIEIVNKKIPYYEEPIETIYIDDNASSHFNKITDSIRIYVIVLSYFLKFALSSIISWSSDIAIYAILQAILEHNKVNAGLQVLICTVVSRVISSFVNYMINRNGVFKSTDGVQKTLFRYYILAFCQMLASYLLVAFFTNIMHASGVLELLVKCIVDLFLFFFSYNIQRKVIFKNKK